MFTKKQKILIQKLKTDSFYKDLILTFGGQVIVMLLAFILNKIVSNQYSVEVFGTYNLIKRFISVISFVILAAQGIAIPKFVAESNAIGDENKTECYMITSLEIIVFFFIITTGIICCFSNTFAKIIFGDVTARKFLIPSCLYAFGSALITYVYSFYRGINKFVEYNVINIIMQVGTIFICLVITGDLLKVYYAWSGFLLIYGGIEIVKCYIKNHFSLKNLKNKMFALPILLHYSLPRIPGEFILFAYNLVPLAIISNRFNLRDVGYFSAAISINSIITPLFSLVGTILLPLVSKSKVDNTGNQIKRKIKYLGIIYLLIGIVSVMFICCFGKIVLIVLFSKDYIECMPLVKLTILSIIPNAFYLLLRNPIDGISDFPYNTICLIISFIIYVVMLMLANTVEMCAIAMFISYLFLGGLSLIVWIRISA